MNARHIFFRRAWALFLARCSMLGCLAVVLLSACSHKIGDGCATNVECSALGDRFCDLSSPGGYCTVEGCDAWSCPDDSVCVRFFSLQRGSLRCDPSRIPRSDCSGGAECCQAGERINSNDPQSPVCCRLGERCLCDDQGCTHSYCASETSERRWCMRACSDNSDCRDNYQCYATNESGTIAVATRTDAGTIDVPVLHYCAPALSKGP